MQEQRTLSNSPVTLAVLLCALACCPPLAAGEAGSDAAPAGGAAASPGDDQGAGQPQDIVDRFFAPLDDAVFDINRDLNKGDTGAAAGPDDPSA